MSSEGNAVGEQSKELVERLRDRIESAPYEQDFELHALAIERIEYLERCRDELIGALVCIAQDANGSGWPSFKQAMQTLEHCTPRPAARGSEVG